jgi:NADPH-dependent 2,4-dienoyl-CoA reductase/sulfur reductase-like enzyme
VTLREASTRLGGMLVDAQTADPLLGTYLGWLIRQVERADVALELGRPVSADDDFGGIDEVIVATGGTWGTPEVADEGRRVRSLGDIRTWLHDDGDAVGTDVVILGDGKAALSLAELCLRRGRKPTVVGRHGYFAAELGLPGRYRMISELEATGARLLTNTSVEQVDDDGVHVVRNGEKDLLAADTVIGIAPTSPADTLAPAGVSVHAIGDCRELRYLEGATSAALAVARSIN